MNNYDFDDAFDGWDEEGECIICGEPTQYIEHDFCYSCFCTIRDIKNNYSHTNNKVKEKLYNSTIKEAKENINKIDLVDTLQIMHALAQAQAEEHDNNTLIEQLFDDIEELRKLKSKKIFAERFKDEDYRKQWPAEFQCDDGHYVRSPYELIIDNWLYHHDIKHEYEKSVFMKNNPDEIILADFYLPKQNVYIEFWGMEHNEYYEKRKEIKIKLYEENNINRIDLNKNDIKRLNDILPRLIAKF